MKLLRGRILPRMAPRDGLQSGKPYFGPLEPQEACDIFQPVRKGWEVDLREHHRQHVDRCFKCFSDIWIHWWHTVTLCHQFEKIGFVTAVVNQHRLLDG